MRSTNIEENRRGYRGVSVDLGHLAIGTSQNELTEESGHSWPPVVFLHSVKSSEEPFMSSGGGVME